MKKPKVFVCEVLLWFMVDGKREQRWVLRAVEDVADGSVVRCYICHAPVRIHRKRVDGGPRDHVEHFILNSICKELIFRLLTK